jgi:hypothetical protein
MEQHARDGSFRSSVRIVHVDASGQRKEPDEAGSEPASDSEDLTRLGG